LSQFYYGGQLFNGKEGIDLVFLISSLFFPRRKRIQ